MYSINPKLTVPLKKFNLVRYLMARDLDKIQALGKFLDHLAWVFGVQVSPSIGKKRRKNKNRNKNCLIFPILVCLFILKIYVNFI